MNDMVASAEADAPANPVPQAAMWLPASALDCYEGDAALRDWLRTPGLLTQRIRAAAGTGFGMQLLGERAVAGGHRREISMCCNDRIWLYARTDVPAATLAAHPWLARIGGTTTLGEAIAAHGGVQRAQFAYARLLDDAAVVRRALQLAGLAPQALWVRRSAFRVDDQPFELFEVFMPGIGCADATP